MNNTIDLNETQLETPDFDKLLDDALSLIDGKLTQMPARNIVSANEMSDLLLDLRLLISGARDTRNPVDVASAAAN